MGLLFHDPKHCAPGLSKPLPGGLPSGVLALSCRGRHQPPKVVSIMPILQVEVKQPDLLQLTGAGPAFEPTAGGHRARDLRGPTGFLTPQLLKTTHPGI